MAVLHLAIHTLQDNYIVKVIQRLAQVPMTIEILQVSTSTYVIANYSGSLQYRYHFKRALVQTYFHKKVRFYPLPDSPDVSHVWPVKLTYVSCHLHNDAKFNAGTISKLETISLCTSLS